MWWLSELGWAELEDGRGWPPCRIGAGFCLGRGSRGVEGWVGWRTAVLSAWLFGPGGARNCLNRDLRDWRMGFCWDLWLMGRGYYEWRKSDRRMMTTRRQPKTKPEDNGATTVDKSRLWQMADTLRGSMDASVYKHVVLGLLFLKYVSDAFKAKRGELEDEVGEFADPEDRDEYTSEGVFWVPQESRWSYIQSQAHEPSIGVLLDNAMTRIESENPSLKEVLPKEYARPGLDKRRLGRLIDIVSGFDFGSDEARAKDVLGEVYEYFLEKFALAEGRRGGEFYTPTCIVQLLVEMLEPYRGRVYDPCCGAAGMFVRSIKFVEAHANGNGNGGKAQDAISIYGQEANYTTWGLAKMNLAIRGIPGQIAYGDTFHGDLHPDLKADFILANPQFNDDEWGGELLLDDKRWQFGTPPPSNANFAWVQHMVHHLSPRGVAGIVLANGSMSANQSGEGDMRKNLIENDLVDCMIALPGQLFYSTQIPACLWFLARDRRCGEFRDRRGEVLFIDARKLGAMTDRTHRGLTGEDITRITDTYHAWRGNNAAAEYQDVAGFCKSATIDEVRKHGHALTPGRYVGVETVEDDGEPFEEKMVRLTSLWREQSEEARRLDEEIEANLSGLGF